VYWVELAEGLDPHAWATAVHLRSVSDAEQDQRDGFGLAAVGVW
ncbi:MAG: CRISPR-associated protein Cmr3, partial [Alphaproteobacteria bacterium]|nr:CRISPR-associated protein Cmr3 [Alphaproteobacteria bacterium]